MATTKKKSAEPEVDAGGAPELSRTAPFKPRNIAAYEAAVEQFATATVLFGKGQFAEAMPYFQAVSVAAADDEPILSDRARTYASICARKVAAPIPAGDDPTRSTTAASSRRTPAGSTKRGRPSRKPSRRNQTTRASCTPVPRCAVCKGMPTEPRPS